MFCQKCGCELPEDAKFCSNCGTSVYFSNNAEIKPGLPKKKLMHRGTYTIFAIAFIFVAVFFAPFNSSLNSAAERTDDPATLLIFSLIGLIPILITFLFAYFCMARRLRDCGKNPYYAWFILIPLFGFCYIIYLCFPKSIFL